jgi:hypothetical protein
MNMFYAFDGDEWTKHETEDKAVTQSEASIVIARECCDPEWPDWVNHICVYKAPEDCEFPDEDGKLLRYAAECNKRNAEDGCGIDYWCDYQMVKADTPQKDQNR